MFQMFFQFELCCMDLVPGEALSVGEWQLSMMKKIIGRWQTGCVARLVLSPLPPTKFSNVTFFPLQSH
jgi:hypothetical protein